MTNEEVLQHYEKLVEMYGDNLPNPEHEPMQFAYIVKMYKYFNIPESNQ